MTSNLAKLIPVCSELEKIAPNTVNHPILLEVVDQIINEAQHILPEKRSGSLYDALLYTELYCEITGLSSQHGSNDLKQLWKGKEQYFQRFEKRIFINGKRRQAIPDQPTLSRFLQKITGSGISQEFANLLLWAQFLYLKQQNEIRPDVILIGDYHDEPCHKDTTDPFCFGTKEGKTVHRTLVFSVIAGDFHMVIATFKIQKKQVILPLFQEIITKIRSHQGYIVYCLLDRGFYRKDLLPALKSWQITTILPGRNCTETRQKMHLWIQDKGGRAGKVTLKLKYVKKVGWQRLRMDVVLVGKRGHTLAQVKRDVHAGIIPEEVAAKRIFPLLIIKGNSKGLKVIRGNENYIRALYRNRWAIEITFREAHLIGIGTRLINRDKRLLHFTLKCFIYNLWQIARVHIIHQNPNAEALTLNEFCGRLIKNRSHGILPKLGGIELKWK